jgi:signal transduction histidine kinase
VRKPVLRFLLLPLLPCLAIACRAQPVVLTEVGQIRALSREEAAEARPVKLRGVVTWRDSDPRPSFFVHDGHWNIWVDRSTATARGTWRGGEIDAAECAIGSLVEIEAVTDPGGYAPCLVPLAFHRIGRGPLPEARRRPLESLLSGREDGQLVEVEGVVQAVAPPDRFGDSRVMLMVDGHPCRIASENGRELDARRLVDARVRVRGILVPLPNLRAEVAGLRMNVMGAGDFEVLEPPPGDPFLAPRVSLNRLLPFSPDAEPFHRKVTEGVVTFAEPGGFFFLQEGDSSVRVQSDSAIVSPGDRVEVAGFIDTSRTLAALTGALVRPLGRTAVPDPVETSVHRILHPDFRNDFEKVADSDFSGRLVRFPGQLLRVERKEGASAPVLVIASDGEVFQASLPASRREIPAAWVEGARLELTGIPELDFEEDSSTQGSLSITGFRLWLRSPGDVRVLSVPSWWTPERLGMALSGVLAVLVLAMAWNLALRRLLRKRSLLLEEVMRGHRDSELEFLGARQERRRLASDLHDGLQQLMAGAAYRVEAAAAHLGEVPPAVQAQLTAARRALVRSQDGLREALWGLQHMEEDSDDFTALLRHAVGSIEHWPAGAVEVSSHGTPFHVSRQVMGSLLLLMQETVGNAFKHGAASRVGVTLRYDPDLLELRIDDDGCGFDPAKAPGPKEGHFGLESARLRMKWLGGSVEIDSAPGRGTHITCTVPKTAALAAEPLSLRDRGKADEESADATP